jgi:hypothetical protein
MNEDKKRMHSAGFLYVKAGGIYIEPMGFKGLVNISYRTYTQVKSSQDNNRRTRLPLKPTSPAYEKFDSVHASH